MNEKIKILVAIVIVLSLFVIALTLNSIIGFDELDIPTGEVVKNIGAVPETSEEYFDCITKNNINNNTIVFIYSNSCPYCNNMKPIIRDLEEDGYDFYWAEAGDNEAKIAVTTCFIDVLKGSVPQFICAANKQNKMGAMSASALKQFADTCS